jgi:predicted TIM-barrel fold metal-dependent hydrolase
VTSAQVLFGTDFPPGATSLEVAKTLATIGFFNESDLRAIERDNAVRLRRGRRVAAPHLLATCSAKA